ncbi:MAG TPA: threonine synthase, partial [Chloroflexi bacterium]|nr:threonine synthase [Chloroflexota bacterium]
MDDRDRASSGAQGEAGGDYRSWLQCSRGCPGRYSVFASVYRCVQCGGLMDVQHDLEALKGRSAEDWKDLFQGRPSAHDSFRASGVWRRKEWVLPQLDSNHIVTLGEGNTPLLRVPRLEG